LHDALARPSRCSSNIDVMMHALGYFSKQLSKEERQFFLGLLEKYRKAEIPKSVPTVVLRSWILRFDEDYLSKQTFFQPYPEDLVDIEVMTAYCDGKGYSI